MDRTGTGRTGGSGMRPEMQVIHVFQEDDPGWQAEHLQYWFGYPDPASPARLDARVLCYCGGRLVPLKRNVKDASDVLVGAIWHTSEFNPDTWLPPEHEKFFNVDWREVPGSDEDDDIVFGSEDE